MKTKPLSTLVKLFPLAAALSAQAEATCTGYLRFIHGDPFRDQKVDVFVNGDKVAQNIEFRGVSRHIPVRAMTTTVTFADSNTGQHLGRKTFAIGPNLAMTVVLAGPAKGPEGMAYGNSSPFVLTDDITPVTNPERWKGTWYRMSETQVTIDFKISEPEPSLREITRLIQKPNRASYQMGDLPAGAYRFNPVLQGSSDPLFNTALNPARNVEISRADIPGGVNVDIIALGNFLGKAPNSLDLVLKMYRTHIDRSGCYRVTDL